MCKIIEDMREDTREQGRIEGKAEGKIEGRIEGMIDLVKKGLLTPTQAAEQSDMTVDEFKKNIRLKSVKQEGQSAGCPSFDISILPFTLSSLRAKAPAPLPDRRTRPRPEAPRRCRTALSPKYRSLTGLRPLA